MCDLCHAKDVQILCDSPHCSCEVCFKCAGVKVMPTSEWICPPCNEKIVERAKKVGKYNRVSPYAKETGGSSGGVSASKLPPRVPLSQDLPFSQATGAGRGQSRQLNNKGAENSQQFPNISISGNAAMDVETRPRSLTEDVRVAHQTLQEFLNAPAPAPAPVVIPEDPSSQLAFLCNTVVSMKEDLSKGATKEDLSKFHDLLSTEIKSAVQHEVRDVRIVFVNSQSG